MVIKIIHTQWFAERLAQASRLININCYFHDLVKLVGKHVEVRTARESWLGIIRHRCWAPYLRKCATVQISCLELGDNDFHSRAEVPPPIVRIHWRRQAKPWERRSKMGNKSLGLWGSRFWNEKLKQVQTQAAPLLCSEVCSAPPRAGIPTRPVRIKLPHMIEGEGCPPTVPTEPRAPERQAACLFQFVDVAYLRCFLADKRETWRLINDDTGDWQCIKGRGHGQIH